MTYLFVIVFRDCHRIMSKTVHQVEATISELNNSWYHAQGAFSSQSEIWLLTRQPIVSIKSGSHPLLCIWFKWDYDAMFSQYLLLSTASSWTWLTVVSIVIQLVTASEW